MKPNLRDQAGPKSKPAARKRTSASPKGDPIREAIDASRSAFSGDEHQRALETLQQALRQHPSSNDLAAELGIVLAYLQREDESVELLQRARGGERFAELVTLLNRYTFLRNKMAARLGASDAKGKALRRFVQEYAPDDPTDCDISISACLIVKNEERHLERCLRSIAKHVDEIVIVDTGSTDSTLEIAKSFGAKIGFFKWVDDFSAARNESLKLASSHWALWIDADEEVTPQSWTAIAEGLIRPQFGGFYVQIVNFMDDEGRQQYVHSPVRIFQRLPDVQFEGRVHEQVLQCFDRKGLPAATLKNAVLNHYGYRPEDMAEKGKTDRTIRMLEREVEEAPTDAFHWFNLANAYSVARQPEDAVRAAKKCLEFIHPKNAFGSLAYQILASGLNSTGHSEEALGACIEAKERGFFTILNQFEQALAQMRLGRYEEALESIDVCLEMDWPAGMTGDYGIFKHKRHAMKGQILSELGQTEAALELLDFSLEIDPQFAPANYAKGVALCRSGEFEGALTYLERTLHDPDLGQPALKESGKALLALSRTAEAAGRFRTAWELRPDDWDCWIAWTQALESLGDPQTMLEAYRAYEKYGRPNGDVLVNWGRALVAMGDSDQALRRFSEAIEVDPANANAYFNTGDLLYQVGAYAESAEVYQHGLRLQPDNSEGWFVLGNSLAQLGILDGARTSYAQALRLEPEHPGARYNLAIVSSGNEVAA